MAKKGVTFRLPFDAPAESAEAPREPVVRRCERCGAPASYGFGVRLREGIEGRWFCREHRHLGEADA